MIIECPACTSRYRIREDKLPEAGGNIKCPNCAHIFFVPRDGARAAGPVEVDARPTLSDPVPEPSPVAPSGPGPEAAAPAAPRPPGGSRRWKLRNPVGLVYDFPDTDQLRSWLSSRESFDGFQASFDAGATWAPIAAIPDLEGVRPTGRKSIGPQSTLNTLTLGGGSSPGTPNPNTGQFATSVEQMREEAEARLREARATRQDDSASGSAVAQFQIIKPPANRQQEQTSRILLLLAVLILPLIAAVGLHIVGVIDLADYGLLPGAAPPPPTEAPAEGPAATDEEGPRRPELTPEQAVTFLMNQAAGAVSRGQLAEAAATLERALEILPDDPELNCVIRPIYLDLGRQLDASRAAEKCQLPDEGSAAPAPADDAPAPPAPAPGAPVEAPPAEPQSP